jgi:putative aldouronate transport system substrate-binding protein
VTGNVFAAGGKDSNQVSGNRLPETISLMVPLYAPEAPQKGAPVWEALNKLTGHNLDLQFVPSDSFTNKLTVAIAGNQLPHGLCTEPKWPGFVNAVQNGMFWDLTEKIKASPALSTALPDSVLYNAQIGGRSYGLPRTRLLVRSGVVIRKDWLDKLKLKVPETMDEFYQVARAFTLNDPDGNGIHDTIGFGLASDGEAEQFNVWAGLGNTWVLRNGALCPIFSTQEFIDRVLNFERRLYSEKLVNQDFATIKSQQVMEFVNADRVGMYIGAIDTARTRFEPILTRKKKENPNIKLDDLFTYNAVFITPEGKKAARAESGFTLMWAFPKSSIKTESMLDEILGVFTKIDSADGQNLTRWGIEGITYRQEDGKPVIIKPDSYTLDVQVYSHLGLSYYTNPLYIEGNVSSFEKNQQDYQIANAKYVVANQVYPFISETEVSRGNELRNLITDARFKYIMGRIDEAGYKAAVDQYMKSGGEQVIKEYNDAYKKANQR